MTSSTPSRRTLLRAGLAGVAVVSGGGVLAGCGGKQTPAQEADSLQRWLSGLDGVANARVVTTPSEHGGDPFVQVILTTTTRLPDSGVSSLVAAIRKGWDDHGGDLTDDLRMQIDTFAADVFPEPTGVADTYLARALWLRRDGRAVAGSYGGSEGDRYHVTVAKTADVAGVVLGINALERSQESLTTVVTSADLTTGASWSDSSTGIELDATFVSRVAAYEKTSPGLTWWADFAIKKGGLSFPATGTTLDQVRARAASYASGTQLTQLDLGCGVAHANSEQFATAFAPGTKFRKLADAAQLLAGVTRVQLPAKPTPGDKPELDAVVVSDRAGYLAALTSLPAVWGDDYLPIKLIRGPGLVQTDLVLDPALATPVFETSVGDDRSARTVYTALADVDGVHSVGVGPSFANLTVSPDVTTADLSAALRAVRTLPTTYTGVGRVKNPYVIHLDVTVLTEYYGVQPLADISGGTFGSPRQQTGATPTAAQDALTTKARTAWIATR